MARAERAGAEDPLADHLEHRAHPLDRVLVVAADHHRQRSRLGARDAAETGASTRRRRAARAPRRALRRPRVRTSSCRATTHRGQRGRDPAAHAASRPGPLVVGEHRDDDADVGEVRRPTGGTHPCSAAKPACRSGSASCTTSGSPGPARLWAIGQPIFRDRRILSLAVAHATRARRRPPSRSGSRPPPPGRRSRSRRGSASRGSAPSSRRWRSRP